MYKLFFSVITNLSAVFSSCMRCGMYSLTIFSFFSVHILPNTSSG